ncbi:MAG TPA: DUF1844 domain-containing protein [Acidisarcina sp.]
MAEKPPLFTVTDKRKFTTAGELREGRPAEPEASSAAVPGSLQENFATPETASPTAGPGLHLVGAQGNVDGPRTEERGEGLIQSQGSGSGSETATPGREAGLSAETGAAGSAYDEASEDDGLGPMPTAAETAQQHEAYQRSSDLLDTMVQQANPAAPPSVQMDFDQLVQSIYLAAVVAMGAAGEPGQKPRIDIIGARQSIDMLAVLGDKTKGNLNEAEQRLLQSALFNLRMMFLEITNALAAQAQRPPNAPPGARPGGGRPPQAAGPLPPGTRPPAPRK